MLTIIEPPPEMPEPPFCVITLLLTVNCPHVEMPPSDPFLIVIPLSVEPSLLCSNTLDASFPLIDKRFAPGPWIARSLLMTNVPDVSVIVCGVAKTLESKLIVPQPVISAIACLRLPAPLALVFSTVAALHEAVICEFGLFAAEFVPKRVYGP